MNEEDKPDLDGFIDRMRAGEVAAEEVAELERRLLADAELRRRYRDRMRLESHLLATFRAIQPQLVPPLMTRPEDRRHRRWWTPAIGLGVAAALIVAFLAGSRGNQPHPEPVVAHLESESEAAWSGTRSVVAGEPLTAGTLELMSGLAELRFESGVLLALEAPARLDLVDPMRCRLHRGTAVLDVPEGAEGFIVEAPGGHAVDHGTRFAVNVDEDAASTDFEVLSGRISVHHARSGAVESLTSAKGARMTAAGIERLDAFPSPRPESPDASNRHRLRTRGKETCVLRYEEFHPDEGLLDPDILMVKKDVESEWGLPKDRRSLIGFDLNGIVPGRIETARLRLNLVPTGLGFVSLLPDFCTFEVYGIRDDAALEDWAPRGLRWDEAPGSPGDEEGVDAEEVRFLGTFEVPQGRTSGPITFEESALTDFVREDTTGEVGFLVLRATQPDEPWSLVHGFASSTHPVAAGPMLELDLGSSGGPGAGGR